MCAVVTLSVLVISLPMEVAAFKDSLVAATLFVSNLYFYINTDYFGPAADTLPLLHTWSLAVEEQFDMFFPILLLISHGYFLHAQKLVLVLLLRCRSAYRRGWPGAILPLRSISFSRAPGC